MVVFVMVAVIAGYATTSAVPPEAQASAPPEQPSCPEYLEEELAAFRGSGDQMTPAFEVSGYWGYEYASTGYGTIQITLLDEDGDAPFGTEGPSPPVTARAAASTPPEAPSGCRSMRTARSTRWSSATGRARRAGTGAAPRKL